MAKLLLVLIGFSALLALTNAQSGENNTDQSCEDYQFKCADGNGCTNLAYRCDGDKDCSDGSDDSADICKENCLGLEDRFQCADGTCVRLRSVCNGVPECADGSDEDEKLCSDCNGDSDKFKCGGSSKCIYRNYICDSDLDCGEDDPSDEDPKLCDENCGGTEDRFQCADKKCVYNSRACNGKNDCTDGSDESDERCGNCNGDEAKTKCATNSKCFYSFDKCDGYLDCAIRNENGDIVTEDNTDEENCPFRNGETEEETSELPILYDAPPEQE